MSLLNHREIGIFLFVTLLFAFIMPITAGNIEKTFTVQPPSNVSHQYGIINGQPRLFGERSQKLYVSIPTSLVSYYDNLSHTINVNSDYARFVTPTAVATIADNILKVTDKLPNPDEQFADAVLALVHQIPYNVTDPQYPVETLADNMGDCVDLSLLAASIMEAGGLSVVLILYTGINPQHMNVGVFLPYTPVYHTPLTSPTSFVYNNKTYWTAEATPEDNWKVGDQSQALSTAQANIIPLTSSAEGQSQAQVAATLNTQLVSSTITLIPSEQSTDNYTNGQRSINISGSITPAIPDQIVNLYINSSLNGNSVLNVFTTTTNNEGKYALTWNFTDSGTYYLTASWSGTSNYAGADSQTIPVFVGPQSYFQFNAVDYNYIFGIPGLAAFATMPMQGADDFLTLPLGTNVSLTYSFIVMQAGQTVSNVPTANVSVAATTEKVLMPNGKIRTVQIPAHNQTVPVDVPNGLEPLLLPDDFNQTIDNQFGFVLQNNQGNYSLNVKGLSQEDLSNMQTHAIIANATENVEQNTWYQVTTNINQGGATTSLSYLNGTVIANAHSLNSGNQTVLLIGNNEDTAIAIKDLTIQTQNPTSQEPETTQKPASNRGNLTLESYIAVSVAAVAVVAASLMVKQRRNRKQ